MSYWSNSFFRAWNDFYFVILTIEAYMIISYKMSTDYSLCMYGVRICIVARGEEVGRQVGRRLAAGLHHPGDGARIALAADQEDSPLQSKRSSRFSRF